MLNGREAEEPKIEGFPFVSRTKTLPLPLLHAPRVRLDAAAVVDDNVLPLDLPWLLQRLRAGQLRLFECAHLV